LPLPGGRIPFGKHWSEGLQQRWRQLRTPPSLRQPDHGPPVTTPIASGNDPEILTPRIISGQEWRLPCLGDMLNDWERQQHGWR
jgi:hypothetical protein